MKTEFNTNEFEFSHGKRPGGRGTWIFRYRAPNGSTTQYMAASNLTYTEAKRACNELAQGEYSGCYAADAPPYLEVNVCP